MHGSNTFQIPTRSTSACGGVFALAWTVLIRPNDGVAFVGGLAVAVVGVMAWHRHWGVLWRFILGAAGAFTVGCLSFVVYFAAHHALLDLWNGLVGLNISYEGGMKLGLLPPQKGRLAMCVAALWVVAWYGGRRLMLWLVAVPTGLMLALTGHRMWLHYFLPFTPWIAWAIAYGMQRRVRPALATSMIVLLLVQPINLGDRPLICGARQMYGHRNPYLLQDREQRIILAEGDTLASYIPLSDRKSVWNDIHDEWKFAAAFPHNHIVPCNCAIFPHTGNAVFERYVNRHLCEQATLPLWVISTQRSGDPWLREEDSPYELRYSSDQYALFHLAK
ncbi:MAG: hypothetical protein IJU19_05950 [Bacteroidales bacterium]|nr:hypothetical protein [Bacteroidales bacterium]